jgi:hypothetical protein
VITKRPGADSEGKTKSEAVLLNYFINLDGSWLLDAPSTDSDLIYAFPFTSTEKMKAILHARKVRLENGEFVPFK